MSYRPPPPDMLELAPLVWGAVGVTFSMIIPTWIPPSELNRTSQNCLNCEYDLRGLPANDSQGVCPECGSPFLLTHEVAPIASSYKFAFQPRGVLALLLIACAPLLPRLIDSSLHWHNTPQILIGGAVCVMAAAMILNRRAAFPVWLAHTLLALAIWIAIHLYLIKPGIDWGRSNVDVVRGLVAWFAPAIAIAPTLLHRSTSFLLRRVRSFNDRRARPSEPVAQAAQETIA